ncbi:MAG: sugar transferase, partial [Helicobacter sp.]|nr:sugar transferase [Helicobacter sp.]
MKGAKLRVLNTLAYKLGAATIEHEKSGGGILSLFYKWWHIKKEHKKILRFQAMLDVARPELKRPPLYTYEDYNEALAAKAHLSYQIGLCVMEADRNKFSGGG